MTDTIRDLLISLSSHMAYMQGQLEARHELDDFEDFYWYRESVLLRQKVTDALADGPTVPEGREPTRDELWELWLRLSNELPDRPAAVAEFWEHAQVDARARAALADGPAVPTPPAALPEGYIDPEHSGDDRALLQTFYSTCLAEGGTADEITLRGLRAVLADGPAVPDGREPASVTGQPSDEELLETLDKATAAFPPRHPEAEGLNVVEYALALELRKARAVLARWGNPAPQPPAEGEVAELVNALKGIAYWRRHNKPGGPAPAPFDIRQADRLDRAADLLQRLSPPQPVPVSELSPVAQAVLDSTMGLAATVREAQAVAAAALRTAADHVIPELQEPDWGACDYMHCDIELYTDHQRKRFALLAIADELENHQ